MGFEIPFAITHTAPVADTDKRYGVHATIEDALLATAGTRLIGLTVAVLENGRAVEYQFKGGVEDTDLEIKAVGTETVQDLQNVISDIQSNQIPNLQTAVDDIQSNLQNAVSQISDVQNAVFTNAYNTDQRFQQLDATMQYQVFGRMDGIEGNLSNTTTFTNALKQNLSDQSGVISEIQYTQLPTLSQRIEAVEQTNLPALSQRIEAVEQTNLPALSQRIEAVEQTNLPALSQRIEAVEQADLPTLTERVNTLTSWVNGNPLREVGDSIDYTQQIIADLPSQICEIIVPLEIEIRSPILQTAQFFANAFPSDILVVDKETSIWLLKSNFQNDSPNFQYLFKWRFVVKYNGGKLHLVMNPRPKELSSNPILELGGLYLFEIDYFAIKVQRLSEIDINNFY